MREKTYSNSNGTTLSTLLCWQRMRVTERSTPVSTADGKYAELGNDDGGTDGGGYFFRGLDSEPDVAFGVANDDNGLETGTLTGAGLFLNGFNLFGGRECKPLHISKPRVILSRHMQVLMAQVYLHNLILQLGQKPIHNLILLDRQAMQINLLHTLNLAGLDQSAQFSHWLPFLLFVLVGTSSRSSAAAAPSSTVSASVTSGAETTAASSCCSSSRSVSHD